MRKIAKIFENFAFRLLNNIYMLCKEITQTNQKVAKNFNFFISLSHLQFCFYEIPHRFRFFFQNSFSRKKCEILRKVRQKIFAKFRIFSLETLLTLIVIVNCKDFAN